MPGLRYLDIRACRRDHLRVDTALPGKTAGIRDFLRREDLALGIVGGEPSLGNQPVLAVRAPGIELVLARSIKIRAAVAGDVGGGGKGGSAGEDQSRGSVKNWFFHARDPVTDAGR